MLPVHGATRLGTVGTRRRPSGSVLKKRRAVSAAFALMVRELRATGVISRYAIAEELNRRRVPTERGGRWHYTTVVRMLTHLGMDKPVYGEPGSGAALRWAAIVRAKTLAPIIREIQSAGIVSPKAIALTLNARGVPAVLGGRWHPTSVSRLLRRIERLAARSKSSRTGFQGQRVPYRQRGSEQGDQQDRGSRNQR
jgi:hypothetical protein